MYKIITQFIIKIIMSNSVNGDDFSERDECNIEGDD